MQDTDPLHHAASSVSPPPAAGLSPARLAAWLRLERTPGVGPRTALTLLAAFGTPDAIFAAAYAALAAHVSPAQARALAHPASGDTLRLIDATLAWLQEPGHGVLALGEPGYPALLANIPDPPLLLYIKGRSELLSRPSLAIVGSRNASTQGKANAQAFAAALSGAGLCIVSGLALGIDAAAHEGALEGPGAGRAGGGTVAVIGTGPDLAYPARNRAIFERIGHAGCIVSEYPIGTPPLPGNFPKRNRIISGLAAGVLVVEAAAQSGSLITARQAAEQGRDVFAIPGSIHSALAKGCHLLIREGAKLVDTAADVLEALSSSPLVDWAAVGGRGGGASDAAHTGAPSMRAKPGAGASFGAAGFPQRDANANADAGADADAVLLAALGHDPVEPDTLLAALGGSAAALSGRLLMLELAGHLERLPGGAVQRVVK